MYTENFNLNKLPFENVPDPAFFFDHGDYRKIRNRIKDSLLAGRGLILITGPIGSGKTTLSQMIKSQYCDDFLLIWIAEPPDKSSDLFLFILQALGLKTSQTERVFILRDIREALLERNATEKKCLLVIDESHLATKDVLDGIRILNNLEEGPTKLIQVLLLGQMEILETLKKPELRPFIQRASFLEIITKMDADRIRQYISHRIKVAGGLPSIFTETGWEAIVLASGTGGGVPRVINSLCDISLYVAFEKGKSAVDLDDIYEAAEELGIAEEIFHYKRAIKNKGKNPEATPIEEKPITPLLPQTPTTDTKQPNQETTQTASPEEMPVDTKRDYERIQRQVEDAMTASPEEPTNEKKLRSLFSKQTPKTDTKQPHQEITQTPSPKDLKAPLLLLLFALAILALTIILFPETLTLN